MRYRYPINARFKARELRYVIGHSGMGILITDPAYAELLEEAGASETCRVVVGTQDAGFAAEADAVDAATVAAAQSDVHGGDDGLMLYTSGTTAHPKGCVHSHAAIMAEGERIAERLDLGPDDRFWTPLPFFHVGSIAILAGRSPPRAPRSRWPTSSRPPRSTSSRRSAARSPSPPSRRSGSACSTTLALRAPT